MGDRIGQVGAVQRIEVELIDAAGENTLSDQLDYECELQARRTASPEVAEAVSAFLGKRKPDFISLGRKPG